MSSHSRHAASTPASTPLNDAPGKRSEPARRAAFLRFAWLIPALPALLLRLGFLASRPVWYDEAFAMLFASKGPAAMLAGTLTPAGGGAADVHPLAYYWLLWGWMQVFGGSVAAARLLSVLFGLGVVWLAYRLGRGLFSPWVGLRFAALAAISPFQLHYAQEIRMYALLAFLCLAATLGLWLGMRRGQARGWVLFALAAAGAQYTQNLAVFFLLPLAATPLLARRWKSLRAAIPASLLALLLYLPWLWFLPSQLQKVQSAYWTQKPGVGRLITALVSYVSNLPLPGLALPVALFAALACLALAGWQTLRALRAGLPGSRRGLWLLYLALAPLALLFAVSQIQPVFIERALLPSGMLFLMWLGWAFTRTGLPRPVAGLAFALLLAGMSLGVYEHFAYRGFPYGPYAGLDASLSRRAAQGDLILHSNKLSLLPAVIYDPDLPQHYLADPPGSGSDTLALPTQRVLGLLAVPGVEEAVSGLEPGGRLWFIIFQRALDELEGSANPQHPHLTWLDAQLNLERVETWGDLRLYVYSDQP